MKIAPPYVSFKQGDERKENDEQTKRANETMNETMNGKQSTTDIFMILPDKRAFF